MDSRTGQVITRANNANRRSFETQLSQAQVRRDTISKRIDNMNDSITKLDIEILDMESDEISGSELGAIKYVSELLDWDIKRVANLFILILIFVFDPLAITLVIATNQAFKGKRKDEDIYPVNTPQVPRKYPKSTPQVEEPQIEKPKIIKQVNMEDLFEDKDYDSLIEKKEEEIKEEIIHIQKQPNKKLSYFNRDGYGKSLRIDRF